MRHLIFKGVQKHAYTIQKQQHSITSTQIHGTNTQKQLAHLAAAFVSSMGHASKTVDPTFPIIKQNNVLCYAAFQSQLDVKISQ